MYQATWRMTKGASGTLLRYWSRRYWPVNAHLLKRSGGHSMAQARIRTGLCKLSCCNALRLRMRGLEPPRGCPHWHLKPARLPIPPHPLSKTARRQPFPILCRSQDCTLAFTRRLSSNVNVRQWSQVGNDCVIRNFLSTIDLFPRFRSRSRVGILVRRAYSRSCRAVLPVEGLFYPPEKSIFGVSLASSGTSKYSAFSTSAMPA